MLKKQIYIVVYLYALLGSNIVLSQTPMQVAGTATITATSSGNWSAAATWGGSIPSDDDRVLIPSGITVKGCCHKTLLSLTYESRGMLNS